MNRIVVWNEPLCLDPGHVINSVVRATEEDVVHLMQHKFPERNYSYDEALWDFVVVHWAWFEEVAERASAALASPG